MPRPNLGLIRAWINITPKDKATLELHYGYGWSAYVRDLIAEHCEEIRHGSAVDVMTVEDLIDD